MTWLRLVLAWAFVAWFTVGLCVMKQAEERAEMALSLWNQFSPRIRMGEAAFGLHA